jgi:hypothetical protein
MACEINERVRAKMAAEIRSSHPDWTEPQIVQEVVRLLYEPDFDPWAATEAL